MTVINKSIRKGRLIVFEGIDGSGKATQAKLLYKFFQKRKVPTALISFPNYKSTWGKVITKYLKGEFGSATEVDPYLASILYAGDRLLASKKISKWLNGGKYVVCDRYTASNIAHQAAKIKSGKQKFIDWVENFEYVQNKIPKENLVIYFSVPVNVSQKLMKGRKLDIHEKNEMYLSTVAKVFESLAKSSKHWKTIKCFEKGKLLGKETIHEKVLQILNL
ncbi:dTMP kinase [Candidatus Curtissbacteria bacterium RIFCSPLOWO2_02_FULL_40_11]|uniref:Thymidylate kinase n=1 Tax=Candidatus Curtissbacteria bacterium RIFCSPHIGHO2_02_FULL_40_16b TaxID=1797714 RepID=A0A1F5G9I0_9BACT|nr:MAG: dTMP kinase [Candidatus Curtissbacteria bacterium RIFCSPHIGHO2_02_FULL_40_16b]OGD90481.1 MAG: dTMP kinase [Candidatus Curtissbacteria bacterium RIFCSPHIGHO2_12_FULL_38_37]OGE00310.1 MAG: dTMP kinase [Candidatus Curtissbacteria bacterium RIFCSPLOWO2_02_FULL_40_11]